jgi:hypothetical protein
MADVAVEALMSDGAPVAGHVHSRATSYSFSEYRYIAADVRAPSFQARCVAFLQCQEVSNCHARTWYIAHARSSHVDSHNQGKQRFPANNAQLARNGRKPTA